MRPRRYPFWNIALLLSVLSALATFRLGHLLVKYLATAELTASTKTILTAPILTPVAPISVTLAAEMNIVTLALAILGTVGWVVWVHRSPHVNLATPPTKTDRLLIVEGMAKGAGAGIVIATGILLGLAILHTDVVDRWATANRFWELAGHVFAMSIGLATLLGMFFSAGLWYVLYLEKRQRAKQSAAESK